MARWQRYPGPGGADRPIRHADAGAYTDCDAESDANADTDCDAYTDTHADADCDAYTDAHADADCDAYTDAHADADRDAYTDTHADADRAHTPTRTPTRTPTPMPTHTPKATPIPSVGIDSVVVPVRVGSNLTINGDGFTKGSVVNFFVATAKGAINFGPLKYSSFTPDQLIVPLSARIPQGSGFVSLQVVNTDEGFITSNTFGALLEGSAAAGLPSITGINGVGIAANSTDPDIALANVQNVIPVGVPFPISGRGFDVVHGVAVDLFCACFGGKVGPFLLKPGNPGLGATTLMLKLPMFGVNAPVIGPGALRVSNNGSDGSYSKKSASVSAPVSARIKLFKVTQSAGTITVTGTGFSTATVINFFNARKGGVVNLGGLKPNGAPRIALALVDSTRFSFAVPASAVAGPAYVQAINPPFVPFSSTGNVAAGAFTLK